MSSIIYFLVTLITKLHNKLLSINDNSGLFLSDKQLHFLIIGALGFAMIFVIEPIFEWLVKKGATILITFSYVFTVILVITFAIEIGQGFAGTGTMDFYDIASGILGFLVFFAIYIILYIIYKSIKKAIIKNNLEAKEDE